MSNGTKWSAAQRRKFNATVKRKAMARAATRATANVLRGERTIPITVGGSGGGGAPGFAQLTMIGGGGSGGNGSTRPPIETPELFVESLLQPAARAKP